MNYKEIKLKEGIKLHMINTEKFKTDLIAVFLTTKLDRENVTKNAVISSILRRGSNNMQTQEQISKELESMYGASFDCGLDKTGDNQILKFYIETINDNFIPQKEIKLLKTSLEKLFDIVFNPLIENDSFKNEYVEQEKNNIKLMIEGKIDNKARYALDRCVEEMYLDKPFGLYKYGYIEDLEKIDGKNLYNYYKKLIDNCKIDIFVSGNIDDSIIDEISNNVSIKKLLDRQSEYVKPNLESKEKVEEKEISESMDVTQGKLVVGLDVDLENLDLKYDTLVYNSILGGSANSKLFQNVREKANLAYVASSNYVRYKSNIFVNCGIEINNYKKTLDLIREQIKDMEKGNFTKEDLENAKIGIISTIKAVKDEQDTEITYYFGQELSDENISIEEYIEKIEKITKQQVIEIAKKVKINTIYFLKD